MLSVLLEPGLACCILRLVRKFRPSNGNGRAIVAPNKRGGGYVLERAYQALLGAVRQNKFQPGQRLLETQICEWLHISRTPVREAMRRLQAQGLLEHRPGGGVTVCTRKYGFPQPPLSSCAQAVLTKKFAIVT